MIRLWQKSWLFISAVLLVAISLSIYLWPTGSQPLVWIVIIIGTGIIVIFTVHRDIQYYRQRRVERAGLIRKTILDVMEIIITFIAALLIAGKAGEHFGLLVGKAVEAFWPGMGSIAGILAGMLTDILIVLFMGLIVHWVWGRLFHLLFSGYRETA